MTKKHPLPAPELDTPSEFAARCNVSVRTIYRAMDAGELIISYIAGIPQIDPIIRNKCLKDGGRP